LAHDQAELLRKLDYNQDVLKELLNTVRKSGPKGKIKLFVPILKQLGVDIAVDKDFKPGDVTEKLENLIYGENPTELKLK
jgi:hypothetical protein